jgi:serine/threonine protein kinase
LGLCQSLNEKSNPNKIFGVIPYLAPEVLSRKSYTKESDIYSFGMILWEHTTGKKPFHDRSHNHLLISDILNGERPQITDDTPEGYADLMKMCWDRNPENRPTAKEIKDCLRRYYYGEKKENIKLAESKRQEIIKSDKFLLDINNYKHHPGSFYTSRLLNDLIQQAESSIITQDFSTLTIKKDND